MGSVVAAYAVAWLALGGYLFTIAARQRRLEREVQAVEASLREPRLD
jgi:CcmD family protein